MVALALIQTSWWGAALAVAGQINALLMDKTLGLKVIAIFASMF